MYKAAVFSEQKNANIQKSFPKTILKLFYMSLHLEILKGFDPRKFKVCKKSNDKKRFFIAQISIQMWSNAHKNCKNTTILKMLSCHSQRDLSVSMFRFF